jgi:hypothetical protein
MPKKSPPISVFAPFLACVAALVLAALSHYRVIPFLKEDTILSGGRSIQTKDFADLMTRVFLIFAPVSILMGVLQFYFWHRRTSKDEERA